MRFFLLMLFAAFAFACKTETPVTSQNVNNNSHVNINKPANPAKQPTDRVPVYTYEIVNTYKHDSNAFTQGLFFHNGFLYETTGQEKKSNLRKVEIESGKVLQQYNLPRESFGEGSTLLDGKIYQVTWTEGRGFVYDLENFNLLREFSYLGQGWGLTNDGKNLIMSDGSHILKFFDPQTAQVLRTIPVFREDGKPLLDLNELEYVNGEIWANVWHSEEIGKPNHIARIDPQNGKLLGWINLDGISPDDVERDRENTLNGIAYDQATGRIFVTGKKWKNLFEIKIKPKE
jgi:glutamine cyclotransferase